MSEQEKPGGEKPDREYTKWDNRARDAMPIEDIHHIITNNETCVFTRLRGDGHPVSAVVGGGLMDGEIYTSTNLFRAAYKNVQRDDRVSVVFDIPDRGSVTVIGRADIVEDMAMVKRFFELVGPRAWMVRAGKLSLDQYMAMAFTPNRRLFHITVEKFLTSDMRTLIVPPKVG